MPVKLVLGLQHGDEGKGRVVDDLSQDWAELVVRFQGGGNAGHTVYDHDGNKFVTHILPVGVLNKSVVSLIARGCVVDIADLYGEIQDLRVPPQKLRISGYCPIIEPMHKMSDRLKYQKKIGTTAKGIGPAYSDFYARDSYLIKDVIENPEKTLINIQNKFYNFQESRAQRGETLKDLQSDFDTFHVWCENYYKISTFLKPYVILNDIEYIQEQYNEGTRILLEGAQGSGLSIHSNNYPDVTSSAPSIGGALNSTGLNHTQIDEVIGVIKSYKTKVGSGDFPTQIHSEVANTIAEIGKEFGATTGRPRMCGWLDLDEVKSAVLQNGVNHICVVKTDVMTHVDKPMYYVNEKFHSFPKINDVTTSDLGFSELLRVIKDETRCKTISYTTGPKRGEIVWHAM
jgi:adenylosuccinate synthase